MLEWVGRDSPYRTSVSPPPGDWPQPDPDRATALFPVSQGAAVPDPADAEAWIEQAPRKAEAAAESRTAR